MWYRYQKCTGALLLWGTGTTASLYVGTCTIMCDTDTVMCGTGTTTSANAPLTIALPGASRRRLPSIAMIYICSLDTNPYKKCARNSKNLHEHKNARDDQRHLFLHKMRSKHELGVLKSYINVAHLCIQHTPQPTTC